MKSVLLVTTLCALALAKKGGRTKVDPNIVNPGKEYGRSPEFNPDLFEGDIKKKGGNSEDRNAVSRADGTWKNAIVPYEIDSSAPAELRSAFRDAVRDYDRYTCVRWVPRRSESDYVFVNNQDSGCYAWLGHVGGKQPLNLQVPGCLSHGTVIHEMLHTLGFDHEQSRNDRDRYITVHYDRIEKKMHAQFDKLGRGNENNQGIGYDYSSVMHYPDWAFNNGRGKVITTADASKQGIIGQRKGFSKLDLVEVNKLYGCPDTSGNGGVGSGEIDNGGAGGGEVTVPGGGDCADLYRNGECNDMIAKYGKTVCRKDGRPSVYNMCLKTCGNCA